MKKSLILSLFIVLVRLSFAQEPFTDEFYKEVNVSDWPVIDLSNYDSKIDIKTSADNKITLKCTYSIKAKSEKDLKLFQSALKDITLTGGENAKIDTKFWESSQLRNGKGTLTLVNGEKVNFEEFKTKFEIKIPKNSSLKLAIKYSKVNLDKLNGELALQLYSTKLYMKDHAKPLSGEIKYSKINAGTLNDVDLKMYDSHLHAASANNIKLDSKYSDISIPQCKDLKINSYDDNFSFSSINSLLIDVKYSDIKSESINELQANTYDSDFSINSITKAYVNGKYSKFKINTIKELELKTSFDNKFEIGTINSIQIQEDKYSNLKIGQLNESLQTNCYDSKINIDFVSDNFKQIQIAGKYTKGKLYISKNAPFVLKANLKYGKLTFNEKDFTIQGQAKEGNSYLLDCRSKTQGNRENGIIQIKGFDHKLEIALKKDSTSKDY